MSWWHESLVGFDLETTGTDPAESRIVSAALVDAKGAEEVRRTTWLVDPGVPVPAEAAAIHGITTEHAVRHGRRAEEAVAELARALGTRLAAGVPVVAFNAPFDLSLLDAELARYGMPGLARQLGRPVGPVLDPLVLDREVDRYRKGSRSLQGVCAEYGVELVSAHDAASDALAAVRVAVALAERHPERVGSVGPERLHQLQAGWHEAWAADFQAWLRRGKDPAAVIDRRWPVR